MRILRCASSEQLAYDAAVAGADRIRQALHRRGEATIVLATGMSQVGTLSYLVRENLDWSRVTAFHLDDFAGLRPDHPGSYTHFLQERFLGWLSLKAFHRIAGEKNPVSECRRLNKLIVDVPIDVAFVGIGDNAHLAFNDPPADFRTESPYLIVKLDKACRRQQVREGWFGTVSQVPTRAISMSIRQILAAETIICSVPDRRKAEAVKASLEGDVTPEVPASILQEHPGAFVFLDPDSAKLLEPSRGPVVLQVGQLSECRNPLTTASNRFHLLVAGDWRKTPERELAQFAQRAVGSGAATVTGLGAGSYALQVAFDGESVRRAVSGGKSAEKQLTTVCYKPEEVDEAIFFFLDTTKDFAKNCDTRVAVVVANAPHRERIVEALADPGAFMDGYINANDTRPPS